MMQFVNLKAEEVSIEDKPKLLANGDTDYYFHNLKIIILYVSEDFRM